MVDGFVWVAYNALMHCRLVARQSSRQYNFICTIMYSSITQLLPSEISHIYLLLEYWPYPIHRNLIFHIILYVPADYSLNKSFTPIQCLKERVADLFNLQVKSEDCVAVLQYKP